MALPWSASMAVPAMVGTAKNYKTGIMQNVAKQRTGDAGLR